MLAGVLTYRDEHYGVARYQVYAQDTFEDTKLYLRNDDLSNLDLYAINDDVYDKALDENGNPYNPYRDELTDENRRLDVMKSNKFKTNLTNRIFGSRVSAILRYMQIAGRKNYNQQHIIQHEGDEFNPRRHVDIVEDGRSASIDYSFGLMEKLSLRSHYVDLDLYPVDEAFREGIFTTLKAKDKYGKILSHTPVKDFGFKLSEELLGFPYTSFISAEPAELFGMYETIEEVIEANPDKNTAWIKDRKYYIVTDANLEQVIAEFNNHNGFIAYDAETTGLKITFKSRIGEGDELVGVVLSKEKGTGYYFPLQHKRFANLCNGDHHFFMERYMRPILEKKKIICHNLSFDWKVAYIYNIVVNCVYDTMIAFSVTKRYEFFNFSVSLKSLVRNIFGLDMFDLSDFVQSASFGDSDVTFADLPYEIVRQYAPADGDMTLALFEFIEHTALLSNYDAHKVFNLEVNFAKVVGYSEFWGYHIAVDKIPDMKDKIYANMEKYSAEMFATAGYEFNANSSQQLSRIMYDELGIVSMTEKRSTDKDTLKALMGYTNEDGELKYPFVQSLKLYRDNEGIHKNFLKRLHEFSTTDGFIFPSVLQFGADTGRTSSNNPNYQSYNDIIKRNVTPRPGFKGFDSDFSQIEYRVLASLAKQESLMKEFEDPDLDYHTFQASRMFGIPYAAVSKALRNQSKGINFGLPFGMGDNSLGARIFGERNKENERKAAGLRKKFFQGQERIEEFFETVRSNGVKYGFTSTYFGRRRYYHKERFTTAQIRRQAGNHVIQGTAADIYKNAVCRMFNRVVHENWLGKVLINAFVHDEVVMEVHESIDYRYFLKAWQEEFQLQIDGFCKLYAGAGFGNSWYEAKKKDYPPQYIDQIIAEYDANPDEPWDENGDKFIEKLDAGFEQYKINRVRDYITDPVNQGKIIKPLVNSLLVEVTGNIVDDLRQQDNVAELINSYNTGLSSNVLTAEGKYEINEFNDYMSIFCKYYNLDRSTINVLSPDDVEVSEPTQEEEEAILKFEDTQMTINDYLDIAGFYVDYDDCVVYFEDVPVMYKGVEISSIGYFDTLKLYQKSGDLQVAVRGKDKQIVKYNAYMEYGDIASVSQLFNVVKRSAKVF